ncbi:MAG: DUF3131 domain-containing protein, partial [Ruminococcaceae bacterium]|nr:DUF3131 domain-containing protein [Oscillospiraceae bacterium]
MKTKPISRLYKHIKKNTAKLNSFYYGIPRGKLHNADPKCFTDNYSIIDRHCKSVTAELAALKGRYNIRAGKDGLPFLYGIIKELAANKTPDTQSIAEKLCEYSPSFDEISLTALFLGCAYIEKLCRRMTEGRSAADVLNELRELDCIDFEELFAKCSDAERILLSDSAYELSDEETKCFFRRMISDTALKTGKSEKVCCTELFSQAEKQGTSVIKLLEKRDILSKHGKAVLCAELVIPFLLSAAAGVFFKNAVVFLLCFLPLQELTKVLVTDNYTAKKGGRILPKVRNDSGLIKDAGTVITVSSLLPDADGAEEMKKHLKKLYLCSKEYKVRVCLLADLDESETAETPKDSEKIKTAEKMTDELNAEFPDRFMLFVRKRSYIKTQGNYSGYERKRGAVEEFLRYIKSEGKDALDKNYLTVYGATENLNGFDYALALDSDTELTRTALGSLLRAALHPLNKAVLSADGKSVIDGFGIFMSKIETDIRSAYKTVFSVIQVGTGGVSAYDGKCSERYFDLFAKSVFTGKGLIDISAYNSVIEGKFKPETVLSHDIIEGEFIGTALDGESCFTDRFPSGEASFLMRAHRWIRGDVQNIIYLFDKRFDGVSRFKLADNLRRALLPVNVVFNLLVALFLPSDIRTFTVLVSLFAFTSGEISRILNCLFYMGIKGTAIRYFGDALPELLLGFSRFLYKFLTLPKTAWNSLDAVLRSLYRVFISRKKLLEWKTAAQSEKTDDTGILSAYNIFQMLISLLFIAVPDTLFRILGLCFLTGVFSTALTSHGNKKSKRKPCRADTELLTDFARRMWKFYTDNCVLDNNYLPPDNVQTAPVFRTAYRTSPTNIGMYLMSALCARDMGFIDSTELYERLSQTLKTVEKLPKYKGNLYNWYDIKTLAPLTPEFVSLVDSGNLLCCLTALRQGVKEYYAEMPALREISDFCTCFEKECDIGFMYNDRKNLFHIGYNRTDKKLSPSYYDLLMSEARMTGYYAVARGTVPVRHWQSLSRAMTSYKGFSGAASWGGTVFEYFLPDLFMPSYKNTLCWESLRYCLMCQRAYSGRYGIPFGISESGYYKFDGDMNYQYKAHGVNRLSMKRESFDERVVSPYSSFLTLAFAPVASLDNIAKLSRYDSLGIYGFYEALDFSERRCYPSEYQTVKSFMAHHLGMSIVGICNYLFDGIMQKRFMRDDEMLSCESLLTEKISRGNVFLNTDRSRERVKRSRVRSRFDEVKYSAPKTAVYSNGEYSLVISDNGAGFSKYKMLNATSKNSDYLFKPVGVFAFFKSDGRVIPLQRATDCNSDRFYFCRFMKTGARLYAVDRKISAVTDISVMRNIPAELRTYRIKNNFRKRIRGDLYIYFEPSLDFDASEKTHRAFSRLFTVGRKENGTVIFERNRRDNGGGKLYCACGFTDGRDFKCCLSREKALQRKDGIFTLNSLKKFSSCEDGKIDCCAFIKIPVTAEAHRAINIQFFICTADSYDELKDSVCLLTERGKKTHTNFAEPVTDTDSRTESLVSSLIYCAEKSAVISGNCNRSLLWRFGISGDYPLIIFNSIKNPDRSDLIYALRLNRRLNGTGIFTEIAVICASGEENCIKALINTESPLTLSKRGGAHIIKREELNGEEMQYIYNFAVCALGENEIKDFSESKNNRLEITDNSESAGKNEMLPDGYRIAEKGRLPWCYCISNGTFGTLLSDKSLGYTFFGNSYLNALTRR